MITKEPALRFWLGYAEREGAIFDTHDADTILVVLPDTLREAFGLPEELVVTADPEAAREEDALLLIPGHPLLDRAANRVIDEGDVGEAYLPWPQSQLPGAAVLQERARECIPIDHGRIDAAGEPLRRYLPIVRISALVTHAVSLDRRFQERDEVWVDGCTGLPIPAPARRLLADSCWNPEPRLPHARLSPDLDLAVAQAHALLEARAGQRLQVLAPESDRERQAELDRADAYYAATLEAIDRRRASASSERVALLDAQEQATLVERARRVAEIDEKFRPHYEVRPFRIHLLLAPALVVPVHIRRGSHEFPFEFTWLVASRAFLDPRCPHCKATAGLVAGRQRLGCHTCLLKNSREH
ncbi:MAG: hypothetical protein ACRD0K_16435 [Egibacteraceae bacterium]